MSALKNLGPLMSEALRRASAASASCEAVGSRGRWKLYSRISELGLKKGMVAATLNAYINDTETPTKPELVKCVKQLRKYRKPHLALEIMEWMKTRDIPLRDICLYMNLVSEAKGIEEAELYFKGLSDTEKDQQTYAALLNCYCKNLMEDQALALFKEMGKQNLAFTKVAYVSVMSLYMRLGQPEKVFSLVEDMKKRNVELTTYTYCIWMKTCSQLGDVEGVERIFEEVKRDSPEKCAWTIYSNLAATYVKAGQKEKAESALKMVEQEMGPREDKAYHLLLSLYAEVSNLGDVHRLWKSLKLSFEVVPNISYLVMLQALEKLEDLVGFKDCYEEWESRCHTYDSRIPHSVIRVYLRKHMVEEAQAVFHLAKKRSSGHPFQISQTFMTYHLDNNQGLQALYCMKEAVSQVKNNEWHLEQDIIEGFFRYFEEIGYVDYGEEFCKLLKQVNSMTYDSYKSLLRTYIVAGKLAPDMVERIKEDRIVIDNELKQLLQKVCPE